MCKGSLDPLREQLYKMPLYFTRYTCRELQDTLHTVSQWFIPLSLLLAPLLLPIRYERLESVGNT